MLKQCQQVNSDRENIEVLRTERRQPNMVEIIRQLHASTQNCAENVIMNYDVLARIKEDGSSDLNRRISGI